MNKIKGKNGETNTKVLVKVLRKCMEKLMKGKIEKQTQLTEVPKI